MTTRTGTSTETSTGAAGSTADKRTTSAPTAQTTRECTPIGVAELAFLALPALAPLRPILRGFNAGPLGVDFKEITERAAKEVREQTIRLVIARETVATTELASGDVEGRQVDELPSA